MAGGLKELDPNLRKYLRVNKLPDVYEALLSGLAVICPADPLEFILNSLSRLDDLGLDALSWDMFIPTNMRPVIKVISDSNLDYIFNFDEYLMPTPEMYHTAYGQYNTKLKKMSFNAWMQYHLKEMKKVQDTENKLHLAEYQYYSQKLQVHLRHWKAWVRYRKGRQAMAFQKIQRVFHIAVGRVIFDAWYNHTLDAKRQREYFERLERGENMEEEDIFGQGTGEARDSISMLPRKVAVKIFTYVDITDIANCACVCRSWKVITQASLLWSKLDFYEVKRRVTDQVATRLLYKARPYLLHLNLRAAKHISQPTFTSVSECRNLQDLNLSECSALDDEMLTVLVKGCLILLYLNVSHTKLTDASLRSIAKYCSNVQYLSLAFCAKFSDRGMMYLASGKCNKKLEYLDLSGCLQLTPEGFRNLANGCTNLKTMLFNEFPTLNDDCVVTLADKCPKINAVSFLGSPLLTDEPFKKIANYKNLTTIKIDGNHRISDASTKLIGKLCPNLEHVYLTDCSRLTDATLKSISACRNLIVLNLADCVRISDTGVRYMAEGPCAFKLRELNLTNCVRVGDLAMVNIHKRCHHLVYLSVCFCENISEAGIELLGQIHSLTSLDLSGCNCGDQGLAALGNNIRLRDVCLSDCAGITDLGLQKFAQQCREIQRLDISHCVHITDGAIKNLAFCCRMLSFLNISGCKLVTDMGIQYLSGVCYYLLQLDISGCTLVSDKGMRYLRKGCKKLKNLTCYYCKNVTKLAVYKMSKCVEKVNYSAEDFPVNNGY
ncbi:dynein regulatory complex subunit 6-like isoform X2 [Patella vulgata]|uniref:dynein regulatory complex subunit 6-like isoform X2 n=1 Tax=Patella vulgata TaxID=6465 RepID=UPI0024A87CA2|nr:dynein regulatory complex subunit 6-like isoform X2 [Patella vulgata]